MNHNSSENETLWNSGKDMNVSEQWHFPVPAAACGGSGVFPSDSRLWDHVSQWQLGFSYYVAGSAAHARVTWRKSVSVQGGMTKEMFKFQVRDSGELCITFWQWAVKSTTLTVSSLLSYIDLFLWFSLPWVCLPALYSYNHDQNKHKWCCLIFSVSVAIFNYSFIRSSTNDSALIKIQMWPS